jgi:RHS repeat-associated protein
MTFRLRPWHCFPLLAALTGCGGDDPKKPSGHSVGTGDQVETACDDGSDNDGDGFADCDDLDCRVAGGSCELAPKLDRTVATTVAEAAEFLYSGKDPLQKEADPKAFVAHRVAIVRGRVVDVDGEPLAGVRVEIVGHNEYGYTLTRPDGVFDMAVNGGARLIARYALDGYLPAERVTQPSWQRYGRVPEVGLVAETESVTTVKAERDAAQVLAGELVEDDFGSRQPIVIFAPGTELTAKLADGTESELSEIAVRVTEYPFETASGPGTIESARFTAGTLPVRSGFNYALDFSVEQAKELGASTIAFSKPASLYVENFLGLPVGSPVPLGHYTRGEGQWQPSLGGRVVEILEEAGGLAVLDSNGDGEADDELDLPKSELAELAKRYEPGATLWRAPIEHFSPWTALFPSAPPPGAVAPAVAEVFSRKLESPSRRGPVAVETQAVSQSVGIAGTPYSLRYQSDRTRGYQAAYRIEVPVLPKKVPAKLKYAYSVVDIAGQSFIEIFEAKANQKHVIDWDGKDAFGRELQGPQTASIFVGYVYPGTLSVSKMFGAAKDRSNIAASPEEVSGVPDAIVYQTFESTVGVWDATAYQLGGFGLDVVHAFDPAHETIFFGGGDLRTAQSVAHVVTQPVKGEFDVGTPDGVAVAADGSILVTDDQEGTDNTGRILRVDAEGHASVLVGEGAEGDAADIELLSPQGIVMTDDGSLIVSDWSADAVRKIRPDGSVETLLGPASDDPLVEASLTALDGLALGPREELYLANENAVEKLEGGEFIRFAGGGDETGEGPAREAKLRTPSGIAVAPDGTVFISERYGHRIRKVTPDGILRTVAGTGTAGFDGDGGDALLAKLDEPRGLALAPDGSLYVADQNNDRIRRITPDGVIQTVVGGGDAELEEGQLATKVAIEAPDGIAFGADGALYIASAQKLFRVKKGMKKLGFQESLVPSSDGRALFRFDGRGKHTATIDAMTGVTELTFGYDDAGLLTTITDKNDKKHPTTITRDGDQITITSPFGQKTTLALNDDGMAEVVTDPIAREVKLEYERPAAGTNPPRHLLGRVTDPKGGEHEFDYSELGLVEKALDPTGYTETFTRKVKAGGHDVVVTTKEKRKLTYSATFSGDKLDRSLSLPDSSAVRWQDSGDRTIAFDRDGAKVTTELVADLAFGGQTMIPSRVAHTLPSGRELVAYPGRTVELSDIDNALSVTAWLERNEVNDRITETLYDRETRTLTTTSPAGRTTTSKLDKLGRTVETSAPGQPTVKYAYDDRGRVQTVTTTADGQTRTQTTAYAKSGFASSQTDVFGLVTSFERDKVGRVKSTLLPDGAEISQTFDENDNLLSLTPPGRAAHTFSYRSRTNQIIDSTPPEVEGVESPALSLGQAHYDYNDDNQLLDIHRSDGRNLEYGYDSFGRLTTLELTDARLSYTYDAFGRISDVNRSDSVKLHFDRDGSLLTKASWSGAIEGSISMTYDENLWLESLTVNGASTVTFGYDLDGLVTEAKGNGNTYAITRSADTGLVTSAALGTVNTNYRYTGFGELSKLSASFDGGTKFSQTITRDPGGRISAITETQGTATHELEFTYDERGRLRTATRDGLTTEYGYDQNGNRTSVSVDGVETVSAEYDAQDRVTRYGDFTFTQTAQGDVQLKSDGTNALELSYDELGNLLHATASDGVTTRDIEYVVDGLGRRVAKRVNGSFSRSWLYRDELRPVAEVDAAGTFTHFVYADGAGAPDFMLRSGVAYRFVKDHLGSVRMVVNATTGVVHQLLEYDAFGRVLQDTSPGFQPFGFAGGLYDPDTKLVRFGARDYDAELGRWTAKDPIGFEGGDTNLYAYALLNPVNLRDMTGLDVCVYEVSERYRHRWLVLGGDPQRSYGFWPHRQPFGGMGFLHSPDPDAVKHHLAGVSVTCHKASPEDEAHVEQWIRDTYGEPNQVSEARYFFGLNDCRGLTEGAVAELRRFQRNPWQFVTDLLSFLW